MKICKRIFFALAGLITAACLAILICALNPSLTQMLAQRVQTARQGSGPADQSASQAQQGRGEGVLPEPRPGINVDWLPDRETAGYLLPADMPEELPPEVRGLWGYEPVSADTRQIAPEEADGLSEILTGMETESGLLADESLYPYYAMLEEELKPLYMQIYSNAMAQVTSFVPSVSASLEELNTVFEAVFNDHPELVLLETGYSCMYLEDGTCVEVTLEYNDLAENEPGMADYYDRARDLVQKADALGSDAEKEKYIHDALAEMAEYDRNAPYDQVAYSAIENGRTVCAGYARAFQLLMTELGIPCYYCTGYAGEAHAWNIVRLDGKYYNVDLTWDDTEPMTYDYFNKTDAEFADTHIRTGLSVYLPACMGTAGGEEPEDAAAVVPTETPAQDGAEEEEAVDAQSLINPDPQKPLSWVSGNEAESGEEMTEEERRHQENLKKAGIREEDVLDTLAEYYSDCRTQMKKVGLGDKTFSNVIPESLWSSVERAYSSGSYRGGYVDGVLKELKAENFSIQIQVQNLGGGYYRIYHNIYTE